MLTSANLQEEIESVYPSAIFPFACQSPGKAGVHELYRIHQICNIYTKDAQLRPLLKACFTFPVTLEAHPAA